MEQSPINSKACAANDVENKWEQERTGRIRIKNRRKSYLDRHPSYFNSPDLELADPLLYDRCIRRFQTAAEREAEGRLKGYSGVLEADLYRSEAKLAALTGSHNQEILENSGTRAPSYQVRYVRGPNDEILPEDPEDIPKSKEEGIKRWQDEMTMRFLSGEDTDFPYEEVDECDDWDTIENLDAEDRWFDEEEPAWVGENSCGGGDTGLQDF